MHGLIQASTTSKSTGLDADAMRSANILPGSRQDPKILWRNDTKVVGNRIAYLGPIPGNLVAQEIERRSGEFSAVFVAFIVRDVSVHNAP